MTDLVSAPTLKVISASSAVPASGPERARREGRPACGRSISCLALRTGTTRRSICSPRPAWRDVLGAVPLEGLEPRAEDPFGRCAVVSVEDEIGEGWIVGEVKRLGAGVDLRSEEHTSELPSLIRH